MKLGWVRRLKRGLSANPFTCDEVVICSYQFARSKAADVVRVAWDVVVIDEAHRLRNVYKNTQPSLALCPLHEAVAVAPKI